MWRNVTNIAISLVSPRPWASSSVCDGGSKISSTYKQLISKLQQDPKILEDNHHKDARC